MEGPTWKWEEINMDFVIGLPQTQRQNDSMRVIVDRLTKFVHFIPIKLNYSAKDYARIYIDDIVSLHGSLSIILDRGAQFTSPFGGLFQKS